MGSVSGHCSHYGGPTLPPDHLLKAPDTIARGSGFKVNVRVTGTRSHCRWGDDASTPTFRWKVCVTQGFRRWPRSHRGHREPWVGDSPEAQPSFHAVLFLQMEWGSVMILGMLLSTWAMAHTGEAAPAGSGARVRHQVGVQSKTHSGLSPAQTRKTFAWTAVRDLLSGTCETQARMRQNIPAKLLLENTSVLPPALA